MKVIIAHYATNFSQKDPSKISSVYLFELFEYEDSSENLKKVLDEMGFDDRYKEKYGDKDFPKNIQEAMNHSSFSEHSIYRCLKRLSPDFDAAHIVFPDNSFSSTMVDFVIPFDENVRLNEWIGISNDDLKELKSFDEKISVDGFKSYLNDENKNSDFIDNFVNDLCQITIVEKNNDYVLELKNWNFEQLGNINFKDIKNLDLFFDNYKKTVHSNNYSASKKLTYKTEKAKLISKNCLSGQDLASVLN